MCCFLCCWLCGFLCCSLCRSLGGCCRWGGLHGRCLCRRRPRRLHDAACPTRTWEAARCRRRPRRLHGRCLPDEDMDGCPRSAACLPRKLGRGRRLGIRPSKTHCAEAHWASAYWAHGLFGGASWRNALGHPRGACARSGLAGHVRRRWSARHVLGSLGGSAPWGPGSGMGASGSFFFLWFGPRPPFFLSCVWGPCPKPRKKKDPEAPIPLGARTPRSRTSPKEPVCVAVQPPVVAHVRPAPAYSAQRGSPRTTP